MELCRRRDSYDSWVELCRRRDSYDAWEELCRRRGSNAQPFGLELEVEAVPGVGLDGWGWKPCGFTQLASRKNAMRSSSMKSVLATCRAGLGRGCLPLRSAKQVCRQV